MANWDEKRFNSRYRKFYILLCFSAACFFVYSYLGFKRHAVIHRQEIRLWSFKGTVDSIRVGDKSIAYVQVNGKEFKLSDYNTALYVSGLQSPSIIQRGDSIAKAKNSFDIKLTKQTTGKTKILHCYLDSLYYK